MDVQHLAKLAALTLSDDEAERLGKDLETLVRYVAQLAELDTTDVPPTAHVQLERLALRPDVAVPGLTHEQALEQAPEVEADGFAVPTFVE